MTLPRPQRITPPARPGALLKRTGPAPRPARAESAEDADYLAKVRQMPCLYCGVEPCGEAAHVKYSSASFGRLIAYGKRPHDRFAVPLCRDDHLNARHAQHKGNEAAFWEALGISPYLVADRLYAQRGDLVAMRSVVMVAIAERSKR